MKKIPYILFALLFLGACSSPNQENSQEPSTTAEETSPATSTETTPQSTIEDLKMGMNSEEVKQILGEPTTIETKNSDADAVIEDWWYGENQKVRMVNGMVNNVVKDVAQQQETLKKIYEAKKKGDNAEIKRLMEELTESKN